MYKSMGAKHSNWQLSQNNQYVSYALLSLGQFIFHVHGGCKNPHWLDVLYTAKNAWLTWVK